MKPLKFSEANATFAEDQPEYLPLPVHMGSGSYGVITSCWGLSWRERLRVLISGRFWFQQMTFGQALQPQLPSIAKPALDAPAQEGKK